MSSASDKSSEGSASNFEPEIGQLLFGQPSQSYSVPQIMESALRYIRDELDRVMWNLKQRNFDSPFSNTGGRFECDIFKVHAYSWSDDEQTWNFYHPKSGLKISWYKYLGRGLSSNMIISPDFASEVLRDCIDACLAVEQGSMTHSDGYARPSEL